MSIKHLIEGNDRYEISSNRDKIIAIARRIEQPACENNADM
jgi:hypothetical protein